MPLSFCLKFKVFNWFHVIRECPLGQIPQKNHPKSKIMMDFVKAIGDCYPAEEFTTRFGEKCIIECYNNNAMTVFGYSLSRASVIELQAWDIKEFRDLKTIPIPG